MSAPRVLWAALTGLFNDGPVLVGANLAWVLANLPLMLILVPLASLPFAYLPAAVTDDGSTLALPLVLAAWALTWLPSPAAFGLAALGRAASLDEGVSLALFWQTLRQHLARSLTLTGISLVGSVAIAGNVVFYVLFSGGWLRLLAIPWGYALLLWISLHVYLVPLALHAPAASSFSLYRRAATIAIGHLLASLLVGISVTVVLLVSALFAPLYVICGGSFQALAHAYAFRRVRLAHGDLVLEPESDGAEVAA